MYPDNKLPLLEFVDQEFSNIDLSNCLLFASQNLLGSTATIIDHLLHKGLSNENISIIGKTYSSSPVIIENLKKKGIYVSPYSTAFDPDLSFDQQYERYIQEFITLRTIDIDLNKFHKIIILDEGHKLLQIAANFLPNEKIVGIEQSSKLDVLKNLNLTFPCITISRTKAKLFVESPMIAKTASDRLFNFIKELNLHVSNVLVIGNGFIGKSISQELRNAGYNVKIYDHNENKSDLTNQELNNCIQESQIIISCVYGTALRDHHYDLLQNDVILASVSLSDRAFKAMDIRKQYSKKLEDCHENISIEYLRRKIHLMNCGFPINFSGEVHSVPPNKIQITRALLLSAIYESILNKCQNVQELSENLQNKILKKFFEIDSDLKTFYNDFF